MIKFLIRHFIKNYEQTENYKVRESYGVLGGLLGVICNLFLFALKITIGLIMNSIAIISDAFNNLSDSGSSIVSIIGAKMSARRPDKEHPFGHGRIEYIASFIVSIIIILVGFELLRNSFMKVLHPQSIVYQPVLLVVLFCSILVKIWMFSYNRYMAEQIHSSMMRATAVDSMNDVIATGAVILSIVFSRFTSLPMDGIMGLLVSVLVLRSGLGIAKDTISDLLGNPPDPQIVSKINEVVLSGDGIVGTHDLIVHDYGPGRMMASVHAEVPDDIDVVKIHEEINAIEQRIAKEMGIHTVIHMDPISINCETTNRIKQKIVTIVNDLNPSLSIHDFRMTDGENRINLIFDLVVPCDMKEEERKKTVNYITQKLQEEDKRYQTIIQIDNSF